MRTAIYDSHGGDSQLNARMGQEVEVLRPLTAEEADLDETGPMYRIRFGDGSEADAFGDELYVGRFVWETDGKQNPEGATMSEERFWIIDNPERGEPCLPEPEACRDGEGPYIFPIVDEVYGGVFAWANTYAEGERIIRALRKAEEQ